jgi:hypothetical protein
MRVLTTAKMADAAVAADIPGGFAIAAGYYGGPNAYHVWAPGDWQRFPGFRLPIWVGGMAGAAEGAEAVNALRALRVPEDSYTAIDLEGRRDRTYVDAFGGVLAAAGYRTWVYGSRDSVFGNPPLNGYWVAEYGLTALEVMTLLGTPRVRAVQYAPNLPPGYDASLVREWTEGGMWHG